MKRTNLMLAMILGLLILPTITIILPSVAGAEEINLVCGKWHIKVDPDRQTIMGKGSGQDGGTEIRVSINDEEYKREDWMDGHLFDSWTINRITGILRYCYWTYPRKIDCYTEPCQKISNAPKF